MIRLSYHIKLILCCFILVSPVCIQSEFFCQDLVNGLVIRNHDSVTFSGKVRHMWIGKSNQVIGHHETEILDLWTDNGRVVSEQRDALCFYVIPEKAGVVTVTALIRKISQGKSDTLKTTDVFTALQSPQFELNVVVDHIRRDSTFTFQIIDKLTGKQATDRYAVGTIDEVEILDELNNGVAKIKVEPSTTVDLNDTGQSNIKLKHGYKIRMKVHVLDTETKLLVAADELLYEIN